MKKALIVLPLLALSLAAFAQNTGHPGGGGPDITGKELDVYCETLSGLTEGLERDFVKSWDKKFKSSKSFYNLMSEILGKEAIHAVNIANDLKNKKHHLCQDGPESLKQRPRYKEELAGLKEIALNWEFGDKNTSKSNKCSGEFTDRSKHLDELKTVIKIYEK